MLDEELIGCINIGAPIRFLFVWGGERGEGTEVPSLLKTNARLPDNAVARLESLHPYDAPAISGWNCDAAGAAMSAIPPDLFFPTPGEREDLRAIGISGGTSGTVAITLRSSAQEQSGPLDRFERSVQTRLEGDTRRSSEVWNLHRN